MNTRYPVSFAVRLAVVAALAFGLRSPAADKSLIDYADPALLTGTVYETASGTNKILYSYKRTATRSNATVRVICDFSHPNGSLVAREEITYEQGRLASISLDEKQTGAHGSAKVGSDAKNGAKQKLFFDWTLGQGDGGKKKTDDEALQPDSIVGDMLAYFIPDHWNELARGEAVSFRFLAQDRLETVGFKLVKESEVSWCGKPALRVKMAASNFVIAQLVDPLFFTVEKASPHHVLEYEGRTTPKTREGSKWKDLDARTIYNWD